MIDNSRTWASASAGKSHKLRIKLSLYTFIKDQPLSFNR